MAWSLRQRLLRVARAASFFPSRGNCRHSRMCKPKEKFICWPLRPGWSI